MKTLLLLTLTTIFASAQWTEVATLDRGLTRLTSSKNHLVAYSLNQVSSSTDGRNWSAPTDPGFPILQIARTPSENFIALSYVRNPRSNNFDRPYNVLIMDSPDGVNWTKRTEIASARGIALPVTGEIAATDSHFYLNLTTGQFGGFVDVALYGNASRIEEDGLRPTRILSLNGDIYGQGPIFSNKPCTFTGTLTSSELSSGIGFWQNLSGHLDLKTTSDDLLIGQNGIIRKGGEIYYGNWKDLGEIQGYHNGVGLTLTEPGVSPRLHLSRDFLRTWTEDTTPGFGHRGFYDSAFFKDQWFVLADLFSSSDLFSLAVPPITYQALGQVRLKTTLYQDRAFTIPGCKDDLTTSLGIELTFPDEGNKIFQVYTSTDLENWTAYGLPFPGATTHEFPIAAEMPSRQKIFFRAEEIFPIASPN